MSLGETIRKRRKTAGLTQIQLAEQAGTTQANISRIERGAHNPSVDTLLRIEEALGGPLRPRQVA